MFKRRGHNASWLAGSGIPEFKRSKKAGEEVMQNTCKLTFPIKNHKMKRNPNEFTHFPSIWGLVNLLVLFLHLVTYFPNLTARP